MSIKLLASRQKLQPKTYKKHISHYYEVDIEESKVLRDSVDISNGLKSVKLEYNTDSLIPFLELSYHANIEGYGTSYYAGGIFADSKNDLPDFTIEFDGLETKVTRDNVLLDEVVSYEVREYNGSWPVITLKLLTEADIYVL